MQLYSFSSEDLTGNANAIKDTLLEQLERDDLLKSSAEHIAKHYVVVLHKPSAFGKWFASAWSKQAKEEMRITIVKVD